jgi:hypothetical protein
MNGSEFKMDKKTFTVDKRAYPEKFSKHFFEKLRAIGKKPKFTEKTRGIRTLKRRKPLMFMNAGSRKCALHNTVMCPTQPCPYTTLNKKIALTMRHSRLDVKQHAIVKTLAFGKKGLKERLSKVFLLNEEAANASFIPKISKVPGAKEEETTLPTPEEKYGVDFKKSDPIIFK